MPRVLGIYVKHPLPGQVKTRLAETLGDDFAAELYRAFLEDIADRFRRTADRRFFCFSPDSAEAQSWFRNLADGDYELWPQPAGNLQPRLSHFFRFAKEQGASRTVVIGSDSPTLPRSFVEEAFGHLDSCDSVIGPAMDGGYYLLGLKKPISIFSSIDWSTPRVLGQTMARLSEVKARLELLPPWYDVDTAEDLEVLRGHVQSLIYAQDPLISTLNHTRRALGFS